MKETLSIISLTSSGKVLMHVAMKDDSGKITIISTKGCESIDLLIDDVVRPVIEEVFKKTNLHVKEVIVVLPGSQSEVLQNRGYIVRESEMDEISRPELAKLLNEMYKIHPLEGTKIVNIAPLFYSVDDEPNIKSPIGMCGKRLEGKFQILFGNQKLVDDIIAKLNSQRITIKKFVPMTLSTSEPFLTAEEKETLSLIILN